MVTPPQSPTSGTEKTLRLSPTIAYSIRKLLRNHVDQLQSVVAQGAAIAANDFSNLDEVIHSLYLESQEINSVIHQLEQLAMSHDALSEGNQFIEQRRNVEEKIFWLLGYKLNRSLHQGTIFIIDDTAAYVRFLSGELMKKGYEVCTASNGTTGLKLVQSIKPNLILLDITMPGIDGFEVCKQLKARSQTQDIPIIFLSATNDLDDKLRAFELGGSDYITKPFQIGEVLARIKVHLRQRMQQTSLKEQNVRLEQEVKERRQAEERYRGFFENSVDGMFQATPDGKFLRVNQALATLYGYESPEKLINAVQDIGQQLYVNPSDRGELLTQLKQTGNVVDFETQVYAKDGQVLSISKSVRAVFDQFDHLLFYEGTVKDLTGQKRTEAALDRNQQLLQQITDKTDALIFVKEYSQTDGTYLLINRKFSETFQVDLEQYLGKSDYDIFPKEIADAFRSADLQVLESRVPIHLEETVTTQQGDRVSIVTKFPLFHSDGTLYAIGGIATDISDRKQTEDELQRTKQHLQQQVHHLEVTLEDFKHQQITALQHERLASLQSLFEAVTEIQQAAKLIYAQLRSSQQQIQELQDNLQDPWILEKFDQALPKLHASRSEADRIHQLTTALGHYCRPDQTEPIEIDIHECIDNVLLLLSGQLKPQLIQVGEIEFLRPEIEVIQAYGCLPKLKCYPGQLHQLFFNLILNAIEAIKWSKLPSAQRETLKLEIQTRQISDRTLEVRVIDQGLGIPAHIQSKIFEPYFTTKSRSQGIGLAICAQIVAQHQGRINVTSKVDLGTEFSVELPLSPSKH